MTNVKRSFSHRHHALPHCTLENLRQNGYSKRMENLPRYDLPDSPSSVGYTEAKKIVVADESNPFLTDSGAQLPFIEVEYETYGTLNEDKSNCILICHALSGDAHVAGWDGCWEKENRPWRENRPGWWDNVVGPGKGIDTNRYFVICSNVLGGCYGTTGPASTDPLTGKPYGLRFPVVTVSDWVRVQKRLLEKLGFSRIYAVCGGSLGGQQALEWALAYPDFMEKVLILASADKLSPQGLAFNTVGRHSIMSDPHFCDGDYYGKQKPDKGLAMARMLANITYLSEESFHDKFGREFQYTENPAYNFQIEYKVESYLNHQGVSFVHRFDANSYLYITKAMDYYDAAVKWGEGDLSKALSRIGAELLIVSFKTDWLYTPEQSLEIAKVSARLGKSVNYVSVDSRKGHDGFLLETKAVSRILKAFLEKNKEKRC